MQEVIVLEQSNQVIGLHTKIRDRACTRADFVYYSDRLIRLTLEEGLNFLPMIKRIITTHTGSEFQGVEPAANICGVSIMRSGEAMEPALRQICKAVRIGKILIQRDEETKLPKLYYVKLPQDVADRWVILMDPMLASGGSACMAISVLLENDVLEERIVFVCLIAAPEGIERVSIKYPKVRIITSAKDSGLDSRGYILPGCGDFGDRYFGTF